MWKNWFYEYTNKIGIALNSIQNDSIQFLCFKEKVLMLRIRYNPIFNTGNKITTIYIYIIFTF